MSIWKDQIKNHDDFNHVEIIDCKEVKEDEGNESIETNEGFKSSNDVLAKLEAEVGTLLETIASVVENISTENKMTM